MSGGHLGATTNLATGQSTLFGILKHPTSKLCSSDLPGPGFLWSASFVQCTLLLESVLVGKFPLWLTHVVQMKSWLMLSISSSLMVLKRDKCSRSNERTRHIIVQRDTRKILAIFSHVKPSPRKSSSTSDGISTDGLPGRPFFTVWQGTVVTRDGRDILFPKCWRNLSSNSENTTLRSFNCFASVSSVTMFGVRQLTW